MIKPAAVRLFFALGLVLTVVLYVSWSLRQRQYASIQRVQPDRMGDAHLCPPLESPGATDISIRQANIHQTICVSGYTETVRPRVSFTNRIKREMMSKYSLAGQPSDYELDHSIPLELEGCPDCLSNLWMEPLSRPGAHEKDRVENYLHREVCGDHIPLAEAQRVISADWYAVYSQLDH
jgi:hypothetical protein